MVIGIGGETNVLIFKTYNTRTNPFTIIIIVDNQMWGGGSDNGMGSIKEEFVGGPAITPPQMT
jgi:hypothetical protein